MVMDLAEREPYSKHLRDYVALFIRRRLLLVLPAMAVTAVAVAIAILLPPVYQSIATVLIEEPEVPRDVIQSTVTSYASRRLQSIQQRVTATKNLTSMINKYNLYTEERKRKPLITVIERFRDDLSLEMVDARVIDPRSGRATKATIAFKLAYENSSPNVAQKIANEFVSLYLSENLRGRQDAVKETVRFLAEEARGLAARIDASETKISRFKQENKGRLPGQMDMNLQLISDLKGKLSQIDLQAKNIKNTQTILESQLAQVDALLSSGAKKPEIAPTEQEERLETLKSERFRLRTLYTARHPDIIRLEKEVLALEKAIEDKEKEDARKKEQLQTARSDLARLEKSLEKNHPDIERARKKLQDLKSKSAIISDDPDAGLVQERNPIYVQLTSKLTKLKLDWETLQKIKIPLQNQLKDLERIVLEIPEIERQFLNLVRDYENTQLRYNDIKNKQIEAELARSLESERKSERFTLIEPPQLPSKPIKPQKLLIILGGMLGGLMTGAGLVVLRDMFDSAIYGPRHLASVTGEAPLITIPIVRTRADSIRRVALSIFWCIFVFGGIFGSALAAHIYWRPLDVLWYSVITKYGF